MSTTIHKVQDTTGRTAFAQVATATVPAEITGDVAAVTGLSTFNRASARPLLCPVDVICGRPPWPGPFPKPTPPPGGWPTPPPFSVPYPTHGPDAPILGNGTPTTFYPGYQPLMFATAYDMPVQHGFGGSGAFPVGILVAGDYSDGDLQQFYSDVSENRTGTTTRIRTGGSVGNDRVEPTLDVETVSGLAPASTVYVYEMPSYSGNDMVVGMNYAVADDRVAVLSMSFGGCEYQDFFSRYEVATAEDIAAQQGISEGITLVAATGDFGLNHCNQGANSAPVHINAPASSPRVVAVGGTSPFTENDYAAGYDLEYAWVGTGGGTSTHFQKFPAQAGVCGGTMRCIPDVALAADPNRGAFIILNGEPTYVGGTSLATPIFAAIQAEIDQRQNTRKGYVGDGLYNAYYEYGYGSPGAGFPAMFRDITAGNNGAPAGPGWDFASGIGSVDGWGLSNVE